MNKTRASLYFVAPFVGISCATLWQTGNAGIAIALGLTWLVTGVLFFYEAHSKGLLK